MLVYTYSQARQNLCALLNRAFKDGVVKIKRRDGQEFVLRPEKRNRSPFNVPGIDLNLKADEIVSFIHEGRRI